MIRELQLKMKQLQVCFRNFLSCINFFKMSVVLKTSSGKLRFVFVLCSVLTESLTKKNGLLLMAGVFHNQWAVYFTGRAWANKAERLQSHDVSSYWSRWTTWFEGRTLHFSCAGSCFHLQQPWCGNLDSRPAAFIPWCLKGVYLSMYCTLDACDEYKRVKKTKVRFCCTSEVSCICFSF